MSERTIEEIEQSLNERRQKTADDYLQSLEAGYKRLTDGSLDALSFADLSPLFSMAYHCYEDYCKAERLPYKEFTDFVYPEKKRSKLASLLFHRSKEEKQKKTGRETGTKSDPKVTQKTAYFI